MTPHPARRALAAAAAIALPAASAMTANADLELLPAQSLAAMAASGADGKPAREIRVLFYGQSITRQDWWLQVTAMLRARFPKANIRAENLAAGGFAAQKLISLAERDLRAAYPDLLLFHVYGDHTKYEEIIRLARGLTTADVVIQSDHFSAKMDPAKPDEGWTAFMNGTLLPAVARTYGCHLADVRGGWRRELLERKLGPEAFLKDGVHLNEPGCGLMARLIGEKLEALAARGANADGTRDGRIRAFEVGRDAKFENGRLRFEFTGNRIDAVLAPGATPGPLARVLIDGRPPSQHPELFLFTRPNAAPGVDWPWETGAPLRITSETAPVAEEWTLTVAAGDEQKFAFRLEGSATGADGEGNSGELFRSKSGRVVIHPEHWFPGGLKDRMPCPVKAGYAWKFRSELLGTDEFRVPTGTDPARETAVTLAQGLANGVHRLELLVEGGAELPLSALRVYRPPLDPAAIPPMARQLRPGGSGEPAEARRPM